MRISDGSSDVCYSDLLVERDIMIAAVVRDLAERHRFDEGEVAAGPGAMIEHREQLILVEPGKRDHVDLDRQSRIARRLDPAQRDGQISDACDLAERQIGRASWREREWQYV